MPCPGGFGKCAHLAVPISRYNGTLLSLKHVLQTTSTSQISASSFCGLRCESIGESRGETLTQKRTGHIRDRKLHRSSLLSWSPWGWTCKFQVRESTCKDPSCCADWRVQYDKAVRSHKILSYINIQTQSFLLPQPVVSSASRVLFTNIGIYRMASESPLDTSEDSRCSILVARNWWVSGKKVSTQ